MLSKHWQGISQIIKGQIGNCLKMLLINTKISLPQIKEKYYEKEIQFEEGGGAWNLNEWILQC